MPKQKQLMFAEKIQSDLSAMSFRRKVPIRKKYTLNKMSDQPQSQKFKAINKKKKQPSYFTDMLKEQNKKLNVNTFIKKLKNSISLRNPPENTLQFLQGYQSDFKNNKNFRNIVFSKSVYLGILFIFCIQNIFLLTFNSLSIIFQEIQNTTTYQIILWVSLFMHLIEMLKKSFFYLDYEENKKQQTLQIARKYVYSRIFLQDTAIFISLIIQLIAIKNAPLLFLVKIITLLKLQKILEVKAYLQLTFIKNQYREQMWSLIKVFIFNFIFAHILTIFLVLMANLEKGDNWILKKQLNPNNLSEVYIWAYYWATTIMLTVGFGDITPQNTNQAFCMILIQTLSCVVLAYNINRLGTIIEKIRSYNLQQINNMKVFNQMSQNTSFSTQSKQNISNYIKQSVIIKRDFNVQEEQNFLSKLPATFKNQLCKEMNRPIWNKITLFQNFSQKVLLQLSIFIEKKLAHPEQIVYSKGNQIQVMLFSNGKFAFTYHNGKSKRNGENIHQFQVNKKQFQLSTLDFLTQRQLAYDIKCLDYSLIYFINVQNLLKILKKCDYDFQYYFMIKDKDKYLMNQFELIKCQFCPKERHTLFKCPKCHYIPLKKHIIDKYRLNKISWLNKNVLFSQRAFKKSFKTLKNLYNIAINILKKRFQFENSSCSYNQQISFQQLGTERKISFKSINNQIKQISSNEQQKKTYIREMLSKVQNNFKQIMKEKDFWQVQSDKVKNFKYYFKNFNAQSYILKSKNRNCQRDRNYLYFKKD